MSEPGQTQVLGSFTELNLRPNGDERGGHSDSFIP